MRPPCACPEPRHAPRFVAVTAGAGAGKTALLEVAQRQFCRHVVVLPEAASILFGGGFPRHDTPVGRCAVQRADKLAAGIEAIRREVPPCCRLTSLPP